MTKMLIVDSSEDFRLSLEELFFNSYRIQSCSNGKEAAKIIASFRPDILILDLLLPDLDGISVLYAALDKDIRPKVLATTRFINDYVLNTFNNMNVDYMMVKPCDFNALAARVKDLKYTLSYPISQEDLEIIAAKHLRVLGVPSHLDGYQFLKTALVILAKKSHMRLFNELYTEILKFYGCSNEKQIDRSIFSAINQAWSNRNNDIWKEYFIPGPDSTVPRPCNRKFLNSVAEKINEDVFDLYHNRK